jgi:hypothetical protein
VIRTQLQMQKQIQERFIVVVQMALQIKDYIKME